MDVNPPEDQKVLERLQDYDDEAGNAERLQKISSGYTQSIEAIKHWLTRFGLSNQNGTCQVQLDMEVNVETATLESAKSNNLEGVASAKSINEADAASNAAASVAATGEPWKSKKLVLQEALRNVERITKFR